jgi:hypothetical protein
MAQQWAGGGAGGWAAAGANPVVGGGWGAPAAAVAVDDADEDEELERELAATTKRQKMYATALADRTVTIQDYRARLLCMASQFCAGDSVATNNLLLSCLTNNEAVLQLSSSPFDKVGGPITSVGHPGCGFELTHVHRAMMEVYKLWGSHRGPLFNPTWAQHHYPSIYRNEIPVFYEFTEPGGIDMLEQRAPCHREDMATFFDIGCLHRRFVAHVTLVLCCHSIIVRRSCVFRYTNLTDADGEYWDTAHAFNKVIIILGIKNTLTGEWLNRSSGPTRFGVDVFNYLSGSVRDNPMNGPVHYPLPLVGDAMIIRCSRYKSCTALPPAGFEVYTYVIWFNTEQLNF